MFLYTFSKCTMYVSDVIMKEGIGSVEIGAFSLSLNGSSHMNMVEEYPELKEPKVRNIYLHVLALLFIGQGEIALLSPLLEFVCYQSLDLFKKNL